MKFHKIKHIEHTPDWCTYLSLDVDGRYLHIQAAREDFALFRYRVRHISGYVVAARLCVRTVVYNRESSVCDICNKVKK